MWFVVVLCIRHGEVANLFFFLFFKTEFSHVNLPFCLKCVFARLQMLQRWGEMVHEEKWTGIR